MRRLDDTPIDPEIEACLDAIDATLAGEPVDPRFAEMAELALLLADERPRPSEEFAGALDGRVERRFRPAPAPASAATPSGPSGPSGRGRSWWAWFGTGGAVAALAGAIIAVILVAPGGGGSSSSSYSSASSPGFAQASSTASVPSAAAGTGASSAGSTHAPTPSASSAAGRVQPKSPKEAPSGGFPHPGASSQSLSSAASTYGQPETVAPPPNGRKIIQSAEVDLATSANKIEFVSQQVFNVVGIFNGIVDKSNVTQTGGSDGSALFLLRIPSASLPQALSKLSTIADTQVVSRTDNSQDVNSQWTSANRQLADDQALRASLLKQLAAATTTAQVDSLKARIADAEAKINADQSAVNSLNAQINYSQVTVSIAVRPPAPVAHHKSGGFTLGKSAHTAGRVLVVAAGVALIALAVLVPVGLVAALLAWLGYSVRRRRREHALDLA